MTPEQLRAAPAPAGMPDHVVDCVTSLLAAQAQGDYDVASGDIEQLAGRAPRPMREGLAKSR